MTAYSKLQEQEFAAEREFGYQAVKHQRFVGTGYFDAVTQVIAGGTSSVTALTGSTEAEQFSHGHVPVETRVPEEMLLPSGDGVLSLKATS
jgi:isocitrate lyase